MPHPDLRRKRLDIGNLYIVAIGMMFRVRRPEIGIVVFIGAVRRKRFGIGKAMRQLKSDMASGLDAQYQSGHRYEYDR